ncbi:MAG TPA: tetratricopeptide repeat protein [Bryobacteraceae bacterium]|nr:tetratricopeptide repeat protein [Bryobacteraceae bacterium]
MFRRICAWVLIASPVAAFGADNATLQLQRDIASLQEQVRDLQKSQDEKFAALLELVRQAVGNANDASKTAAVLQSSLQQNLQSTQDKVVAPVAGLSSRMDQVSSDVSHLANAVSDLTSSMAKMQTQLTDLVNQVKVMQAPPAPPAATPGVPGAMGAAPSAAPPISATELYNDADRDRNGGHLDMAVQEFGDFLKYYPDSAQAPAAQFYIGFIHYGQRDYETAVQDFQGVIDKYPDDDKRVPEAMLYKGLSLERITGHKTEASNEYKELIKRFPRTDPASKACTQLQGLGLRCGAPASSSSKKKKE